MKEGLFWQCNLSFLNMIDSYHPFPAITTGALLKNLVSFDIDLSNQNLFDIIHQSFDGLVSIGWIFFEAFCDDIIKWPRIRIEYRGRGWCVIEDSNAHP